MMLHERILPDGRQLSVYPLTFNRGRLSVGQIGVWVIDVDDSW